MTSAATSVSTEPASGFIAFRSHDFRRFLGAGFLAGAGVQMLNVAAGWLIYHLTQSALALGLLGLTVFLPSVLLVLVTGQVADRIDRRHVLIIGYGLIALGAAALSLFVALGGTLVWPVYLLIGLIGTARAFTQPAGQAMTALLVPREHLGNAISWRASTWQTASITGPAIGGLLLAVSPLFAFGATAIAFVVAVILIKAIRTRPVRSERPPISLATVLGGISFIRDNPIILGAMSLDLFGVLLGGASALFPIYATDILHVGPAGLGLLRAAPAMGGVCTALLLARFPLRRRVGRHMLRAMIVFGLGTIGFGLSTTLWLSLLCLAVLGAADVVNVYVRQTLVQSLTPDEMRGRVAAVSSLFIGASNELGEFESGALAAAFGVVPSVVIGGAGTILIALLWGRLFPMLRDRDQLIDR